MLKDVLSLLWAILVTGGMMALAYWFTRHIVGNVAASRVKRGCNMMVLEQISLGKDQRLMLVRIGQRIHILATSPGGVTDLGELSQQEAAELIQIQEDRPKAPDGFVQALHQVLEKKKRGGSGDGRMD